MTHPHAQMWGRVALGARATERPTERTVESLIGSWPEPPAGIIEVTSNPVDLLL